MKASEAVARLDTIEAPEGTKEARERALEEARNVVMLSVASSVREAYMRATDRLR